jgi:hypothetical protein
MDAAIQGIQHIFRKGQRIPPIMVIVDHCDCRYRRNNEKHAPQGNDHSQKPTFKSLPAGLKIHIDVNQFSGLQGYVSPMLLIGPG